MEKLSEIKLDLLEKIISLPYFLFILSVALFTDTFLLAVYGETIRTIDGDWLKGYLNPREISAYIGAFGFFYAAFVPGLLFFLSIVASYTNKRPYPEFKDGWVHVDKIRDFAVIQNNQIAYSEFLRLEKRIRDLKHMDVMCFGLLFLSITGYFLSPSELEGLFQFLYYGIEKFPWYMEFPLKIAVGSFILFVLAIAARVSKEYDQYERWEKLKIEIERQ